MRSATSAKVLPHPSVVHRVPSNIEPDDIELLHLVAQRQTQALSLLYDRHAHRLLALSLRMLGNRSDAEDVLQEVFIYVWRQARNYAANRSSVSTWLILITRSRTLDHIRTRQRLPTNDGQKKEHLSEIEQTAIDGSSNGLRQILSGERRRRVREAITHLPEAQRQVLELFYFGGLTQKEIAEYAGIPIGTVKSRTLLAFKKLRAELTGELDSPLEPC